MNTGKRILMLTAIAGLFTACSGDDDSKSPIDNGDGAANGIITSLNDPDFNVSALKGKIGANIELPAGDYVLSGDLVIQAPYTLKINPGTTFKAVAGGSNVYLAVEQGAKIDAQGTAAAPIRFTSNASSPAAGDWGGIMIMGYAPLSGGGSAVTEVVDFFYGGDNTNDNSGVLSHVIIEYSGARINDEKEFNGLTLYGVGKGTTINNIAVFNNDDDTIEFFGGSVDVTNLLVVNSTDDLIDWTQGYNGTITNAYAIREEGYNSVSSDPRGIEADGNLDGLAPGQTGQSNPTVNGLTIVNNAAVEFSDIFKIRRGSGATITNALVIWGANSTIAGDFVDCTDSLGDAMGSTNISVSVSGNVDAADIKVGANNATVNVVSGNTGANTSAFSWTGYQF